MAITTVIQVVTETRKEVVLHITGIQNAVASDQTNYIVADKSTFLVGSTEPAALDLERLRWNSQGFTFIQLKWDHTIDATLMVLNGSGAEDFLGAGWFKDQASSAGLRDPEPVVGEGDITLTTAGGAENASYDMTLWFRKRAA